MSTTNNTTTEKVISKVDLNGHTYKFKDAAAREQLLNHNTILQNVAAHIENTNNPHQVELSDFGVNATATEINILSGVSGITSNNINNLSGLTENVQNKLSSLDTALTQLNADMLESIYYIETELTGQVTDFMGEECQVVTVQENLASIVSKKSEGKNPCLLLKPFSLIEDNTVLKNSTVPLFLTREIKVEDEMDGTVYLLLFSSSTVLIENGLASNTSLASTSGIINILLTR